jgi:hypothetical protein
MPGEGQQFYSESDAQEILRRAASSHTSAGGLSRDELLRTAAELGVSPEAVARAEAEYFAEREQNRDIDEFRRQHRAEFRTHLVIYAIINIFLLCINLLTSADHLWFFYPLLGWGIGIAIHGYTTYNEDTSEWRKEFEDWKRKREWQPSNSLQAEGVRAILERELVLARDSGEDASKIELIKQVREGTGLGLKESKDAVEYYLRQNPGAPVD